MNPFFQDIKHLFFCALYFCFAIHFDFINAFEDQKKESWIIQPGYKNFFEHFQNFSLKKKNKKDVSTCTIILWIKGLQNIENPSSLLNAVFKPQDQINVFLDSITNVEQEKSWINSKQIKKIGVSIESNLVQNKILSSKNLEKSTFFYTKIDLNFLKSSDEIILFLDNIYEMNDQIQKKIFQEVGSKQCRIFLPPQLQPQKIALFNQKNMTVDSFDLYFPKHMKSKSLRHLISKIPLLFFKKETSLKIVFELHPENINNFKKFIETLRQQNCTLTS